MKQTICDKCGKNGGFAKVEWKHWSKYSMFHPLYRSKDLCKECFNKLFPEWNT